MFALYAQGSGWLKVKLRLLLLLFRAKPWLSPFLCRGCRCQEELKAFYGSKEDDEEILSGKAEASERQRLCASVRGGERTALQVRVSSEKRR